MDFAGFDKSLVRFLGQLKRNNNRRWFMRNRDRYEAEVRRPVLAFIRAIAPRIERISPQIVASDAKVGGSMMRPYRDIVARVAGAFAAARPYLKFLCDALGLPF